MLEVGSVDITSILSTQGKYVSFVATNGLGVPTIFFVVNRQNRRFIF